MDWKKLKSLISPIRAQLVEKIQVSDKGDVYIGGQHYHYHDPLPDVVKRDEVKKIVSELLSEEMGKLIDKMVVQRLEAQKEIVQNLTQQEQIQFLVNSTGGSIQYAITTKGELGFKGDVKWKMTDRSHGE